MKPITLADKWDIDSDQFEIHETPVKLFDENEPRVPSGPGGGEWTSGGAPGGNGHADHPPNAPSEKVHALADKYRGEHGLSPNDSGYKHVDPSLAAQIADAYDAMAHEPNDAETKASYDAFKSEVDAQWKAAEAAGFKFEPWTKEGQPYADSAAMVKDVTENGHLFFFRGGEMPSDHPLAAQAGGGLTFNDKFRAIHDLFAHAGTGNAFGARGEFNAFLEHASMFTEKAVHALATETLGQNSWVNYGKHIRNNPHPPDAAHRPYAAQKAGLLPRALIDAARRRTSLSDEGFESLADFSNLDDLIQMWADRLGLDPAQAAALGEEFKAQAFTMAGVWDTNFLNAIRDSLTDAIALGETVGEWKDAANAIVESYSVETASGDQLQGPYADLVFRQATINAQAAGRYASMFNPRNVLNDPFWLFQSVEDDRLDEECAALDGMVFDKTDSDSRTLLPPIHFNCRCVAIPMNEGELADGNHEVSSYSDATMPDENGDPVQVTPDAGFGGDKVAVYVPDVLKRIALSDAETENLFNPNHEPAGSPEGGEFAPAEEAPLPPDVNKYGRDHPITRDDGSWGYSHGNSSLITGGAAAMMDAPGWDRPEPGEAKWAEAHASRFLQAIADDKLGAEHTLYHSFANVRGTKFNVGDTITLPLAATSGENEGYGRRLDPKDQRGEPMAFKFVRGTPIAGYSRWSVKDQKESAQDAAHPSHVWKPWSEAIVGGKFEVVSSRREPEWSRMRHDGTGWNHGDMSLVVTLRPTHTFDPTTKTWHPTKTRLLHHG